MMVNVINTKCPKRNKDSYPISISIIRPSSQKFLRDVESPITLSSKQNSRVTILDRREKKKMM